MTLLERRYRRQRRLVSALATALVCAIPIIGIADVPNTFEEGEVISASAFNENFQSIDEQLASLRSGSGAGVVGLGSIIAHTTHLDGAASISEMQQRGFALCDGTSPMSQGIEDPVIVAATPNLNGRGRFLRGGETSGVEQDDATSRNGLALSDPGHSHISNVADSQGECNEAPRQSGEILPGPASIWDAVQGQSGCRYTTTEDSSGVSLGGGDVETRPTNMSVVWMMRVR